jgi:undecaprenyl pyrophosphate phosphatase UppP
MAGEMTLLIPFAVVVGGILLIWAERSRPKRDLRRENWNSVLFVAIGIGVLITDRISASTFKFTDLFYYLLVLAGYTGFVYLWNRRESPGPQQD